MVLHESACVGMLLHVLFACFVCMACLHAIHIMFACWSHVVCMVVAIGCMIPHVFACCCIMLPAVACLLLVDAC